MILRKEQITDLGRKALESDKDKLAERKELLAEMLRAAGSVKVSELDPGDCKIFQALFNYWIDESAAPKSKGSLKAPDSPNAAFAMIAKHAGEDFLTAIEKRDYDECLRLTQIICEVREGIERSTKVLHVSSDEIFVGPSRPKISSLARFRSGGIVNKGDQA